MPRVGICPGPLFSLSDLGEAVSLEPSAEAALQANSTRWTSLTSERNSPQQTQAAGQHGPAQRLKVS